MKEIIEFYNNYDEEGRLLKKNRLPEYITTMRYIEKYLTPNSRFENSLMHWALEGFQAEYYLQ